MNVRDIVDANAVLRHNIIKITRSPDGAVKRHLETVLESMMTLNDKSMEFLRANVGNLWSWLGEQSCRLVEEFAKNLQLRVYYR